MDQDGIKLSYNLRFPGQYYDQETGKHYNFNRDYDPVTGRYVQSDPIGLDGGMNGYGYVSNNTFIYFDANGLCVVGSFHNFYEPNQPLVISACTANGYALPRAPWGVANTADLIVHRNVLNLRNQPWYARDAVWLNRVRPGGGWDYKRIYGSIYQDLGNFNYGLTGASLGFSLGELMLAGGAIATIKGQTNLGPFNDQWIDQYWVKEGYNYYIFTW